MRRRDFIKAIAGLALTGPLAARAQSTRKTPIVGFLGAASATAWAPQVASFTQRLRELGWVDGESVSIAYRWAEGQIDRYAVLAAELVELRPEVIVTVGSGIPALKRATSTIPIVFAAAVDPLGSGFVNSLARPGGNVTGLSLQSTDMASKRIALLRQIMPDLNNLAIIADSQYPAAVREAADVAAAAQQLRLSSIPLKIQNASDLAPAIGDLNGKARALYVCTDALMIANVGSINALAQRASVATVWSAREFSKAGGFMSYGANEIDLFRRAGDYVNKILRGANPADLPVEQPTKIELVINLKIAKALGLTVPAEVLALADEVIE